MGILPLSILATGNCLAQDIDFHTKSQAAEHCPAPIGGLTFVPNSSNADSGGYVVGDAPDGHFKSQNSMPRRHDLDDKNALFNVDFRCGKRTGECTYGRTSGPKTYCLYTSTGNNSDSYGMILVN